NDCNENIAISFSPTESHRFGRKVIRFNVKRSSWKNLKTAIESKFPELAIVRLPTDRFDLVNKIFKSFRSVYLADTAVEYGINLKDASSKAMGFCTISKVIKADERHVEDLDSLVSRSFSGYRSHYVANRDLPEFDLTLAYQEWTRSCLSSPEKTCFMFYSESDLCGFFAAETRGKRFRGLLSGVLPEYRRRGVFKEIIRTVKFAFQAEGANQIVTQVLLENDPVHKVLLHEGFSISGRYFTIHINMRVPHITPPSRRWSRLLASLDQAPRRKKGRLSDYRPSLGPIHFEDLR
ncbi:MAG: GNAT family N-acetyltransferase, partial [Pseudomonadota bacterium]